MGLFDRFRKRQKPGTLRGSSNDDTEHLVAWAKSRRGVEAYVEPKTTVTDTTVVLIAYDGEWTRRRIDGPEGARKLGKKLSIPVYDVALVGYPKRMREYTERQRINKKRAERDDFL